MSYPAPFGALTEREQHTVEQARAAATIAAAHAARHDRDGTFPVEGLVALEDSGYLSQVLPEAAGGGGATVAQAVLGNVELARGDASLALVVAMHGALLGRVRDAQAWPPAVFDRVASSGGLINSLASEPEMGSPSRGGLPATLATAVGSGWRIKGRKTFSSGAPVLHWGVVSAAAEGALANFLVPLKSPGVSIEPSWDTLGMRATNSHTVVFDEVQVDADAELPRPESGGPPHERAWSLTVAAVYLGVAEAARDFAVRFARERTPSALGGKSIASVPHIRQRAGRMELLLFQARGLLVSTARAWDAQPSADMEAALASAKVVTSNTAVAVAEEAMRLVGGSSLDRGLPLERHYRDVRGGLHHPPQDDAALELLARQALD